MSSKPTIGFVGLGAMGFGMATHLVKQGYSVKGFDVFPKSVERFKAAGGTAASSLRDSATDVDFYIVMVATAAQAQEALFDKEKGLVQALKKDSTLLLCSTVPSTYALSVLDQLKAANRPDISFIDSPVSGGAARAASGTLSIMAGAPKPSLSKGQFLLEELSDSDKLFLCGDIGAGSNMKMVHQVLAGIHILAASESMGFAARLGLDAKETMQKVIGSDSWAWMFEHRVPRMLEEDYYPGVSATTIILKDVGIITTTARLHNLPVPLVSIAEQAYVAGLGRGWGANDDAGMVRMYYADPISKVKKGEEAPRKPLDNEPLSTETPPPAMELVLTLLRTIYILSCAEAVALAHALGVDMDMYFTLVKDAAGGSRMFEKYSKGMRAVLDGDESGAGEGQDGGVDALIKGLLMVVKEARRVECPLFLGCEALNLLLLARRKGYGKQGAAGVVALLKGESGR